MPHNQDPAFHSKFWETHSKDDHTILPPNIEKGRSKTGKSPRSKIDGGRIRNSIQKTLIMSATRNNLPWFNQIREIKIKWQLAEPQLMSTHRRIIKFIGVRLIFSKDTRRKNPWLNDFHKSNSIFIVPVNIIKVKCGLKMGVIIPICKPNDGS
jgi:hypothetical protein